MQVLIEAGSASSFELSPRFSNAFSRHHSSGSGSGKRETQDVEKELEEAMSETLLGEDNLLDGKDTISLNINSYFLSYFNLFF